MKPYSVKTGLIQTYKIADGSGVEINISQNSDKSYDVEITGTFQMSDGKVYDGTLEYIRAKEQNLYLSLCSDDTKE